jgi:hypothetical protein
MNLLEAPICAKAVARLRYKGWQVGYEIRPDNRPIDAAAIVNGKILALEAKVSFNEKLRHQLKRLTIRADYVLAVVGSPPRQEGINWCVQHKIGLWIVTDGPIIGGREGQIGNRKVPNYVKEAGVNANRETETFAQVTLWIDNWRWAGVPFVLRSGKALGKDRREIAIHFKSVPHLAFTEESRPRSNVLRLELNPDRMALGVNINGTGDPFDLEYVELDLGLAPQEISAYGRLLMDVIKGDLTLSIRDDEAEESWRIVEPILEAWRAGQVPLLDYSAGSPNLK